jgi:hypothetical protein
MNTAPFQQVRAFLAVARLGNFSSGTLTTWLARTVGDRDRFAETVGSSSGLVLLLLDARLLSTDDLESLFPSRVQSSGDLGKSSPVRKESSHVLKKSSPVRKKSSPVLKKSSPVLKDSCHVLKESSPLLKESSPSRFQ